MYMKNTKKDKRYSSDTGISEELLSAYFRGDISDEDAGKVLDWTEENESNLAQYMALRRIYDSLLMSGDVVLQQSSRARKGISGTKHIIRKVIAGVSIAAAIAVAVIAGHLMKEGNLQDTPQTVIMADKGCRNECLLDDGTRVVLNSGAEIRVMEMSGKERKVTLRGEAYFEVARDVKRPFIVNTGKMSVSVLGTQFNVNTDGEEHTVVLVDGSVNVRTVSSEDNGKAASGKGVTIAPGDMFSTYGGGTVTKVDTEMYTSWMSGYIILDNTPVADVIERIARYYGKKIIFDGEKETDLKLTGKFDIDSGFDAVMDNLCAMTRMTCTRPGSGDESMYDLKVKLKRNNR